MVIAKLENVAQAIRGHPHATIPILLDFLQHKAAKYKLTLIIALCQKDGNPIKLDALMKWTAAAWDLARNGNTKGEFNKNLSLIHI